MSFRHPGIAAGGRSLNGTPFAESPRSPTEEQSAIEENDNHTNNEYNLVDTSGSTGHTSSRTPSNGVLSNLTGDTSQQNATEFSRHTRTNNNDQSMNRERRTSSMVGTRPSNDTDEIITSIAPITGSQENGHEGELLLSDDFTESDNGAFAEEDDDDDDIFVTLVNPTTSSDHYSRSTRNETNNDNHNDNEHDNDGTDITTRNKRKRQRATIVSSDSDGADGSDDDLIMLGSDGETAQKVKTTSDLLADKQTSSSSLKDVTCPICMDEIEKCVASPCGHFYCSDCVYKALASSQVRSKNHGICSLCRKTVSYKDLVWLKVRYKKRQALEPEKTL